MTEQHKASEEAAREKRRLEIAPLIESAKAGKLWLHIPYQDLWISPEDLEKSNAEGRFLFDAKTIRLRPPSDYIEKLDADILKLTNLRGLVYQKMNGGVV